MADELALSDEERGVIEEQKAELYSESASEKVDTPVEAPEEHDIPVSSEVDEVQFTDDHRRLAASYGLDVNRFENPEQLERRILDIDRGWADYVRKQQSQQQRVQQPIQQPVQQPVQQPGQQTDVPFKFDINTEDFSPELVGALNKTMEQVYGHYNQLQQTVQQMQQYMQWQAEQVHRQQLEQERQLFMDAVQSLDHKSLYGDGQTAPNQQQYANVVRLYQEAEVLANSYRMRGMQIPAMRELIRRAEQLAFPSELESFRRQTQGARAAQQARQRLGSGRRTTAEPARKWDGDPEDNPVLRNAWNELVAARQEK